MVHSHSKPDTGEGTVSDPVQSLWIGERLGALERLSIQSFLDHGHPVRLYLYGPCADVPAGAEVCDGREILPESAIFRYRSGYGAGSPSGFANLFRYAMLHQHGGWWVDLDVVALRPLQFTAGHVMGRSSTGPVRYVENAIIRAPAGSPLMAYCLEAAQRADRDRVRWGQTGPQLLTEAVTTLGMEDVVTPPSVFYPVSAARFWDLLGTGDLPASATAVHLWAQQWRYFGVDPAARFPEASCYQRLVARHLPALAAAPRPVVNVPWLLVRSVPLRLRAAWRAAIMRARRRGMASRR